MVHFGQNSNPGIPIIVTFFVLCSIIVAFASLLTTVAGESPVQESGSRIDAVKQRFTLDAPSLKKLKVRQLREMLELKGASCDACVSKADLVERIAQVHDWEDKPEPLAFDTLGADFAKEMEGLSPEERLEKLREKLKEMDPNLIAVSKSGKKLKSSDAEFDEFLKESFTAKDETKESRPNAKGTQKADVDKDGSAKAQAKESGSKDDL